MNLIQQLEAEAIAEFKAKNGNPDNEPDGERNVAAEFFGQFKFKHGV